MVRDQHRQFAVVPRVYSRENRGAPAKKASSMLSGAICGKSCPCATMRMQAGIRVMGSTPPSMYPTDRRAHFDGRIVEHHREFSR